MLRQCRPSCVLRLVTEGAGLNSQVLASNNEMVILPVNEPTFGTRRKSQIQTYLEQNEVPRAVFCLSNPFPASPSLPLRTQPAPAVLCSSQRCSRAQPAMCIDTILHGIVPQPQAVVSLFCP